MTTDEYIDYLKTLDEPDRFKAIVSLIKDEADDDSLRQKLKVVFDIFDFAITRDLMEQCEGKKARLIEILIENRHNDKYQKETIKHNRLQ
jgi:hypothetical protein